LLNFDLSKVDLRSVPKTKALLEQKLHSLGGEQAWWLGVLMRGELPGAGNEPRCCLTEPDCAKECASGYRPGTARQLAGSSLSSRFPRRRADPVQVSGNAR